MTFVDIFSFQSISHMLFAVSIGVLIGWVHFRALRWNADLFLGNQALWRPLGLQLIRMLITATALYICARLGASLPPLVVGLLLARFIVLKRADAK